MSQWNPWHGCHKYSPGCLNCYVYRGDAKYERDASVVKKTKQFDLPLKKTRSGEYKLLPPETVYTCFTSDFLVSDADEWRREAWRMMRLRSDLSFFFITKRILRFGDCAPDDWGDGYENVSIGVTCENQAMADERLPCFLTLPVKQRSIILEPMLESIDISKYLTGGIARVVLGGESGESARLMRYEWAKSVSEQCRLAGVPFWFKQTGARFEKDGRLYRIKRADQMKQARKSLLSSADFS